MEIETHNQQLPPDPALGLHIVSGSIFPKHINSLNAHLYCPLCFGELQFYGNKRSMCKKCGQGWRDL